MTSHVHREKYDMAHCTIRISCDQIDCSETITDTEITAGGGLKKMGWTVAPRDGKQLHHYCPAHTR